MRLAATQIKTVCGETLRRAADIFSLGGDLPASFNAQCATGNGAVVGLHTRPKNRIAGAVHLRRTDRGVPPRREGAAVAECTRRSELGIALCIEHTGVLYIRGGIDHQLLAAVDLAAVHQHAIGRYRNIARRRPYLARIVHTDTAFSANQANFTGVHAPQMGDIHRHGWPRAAIGGFGVNVLMGGIHLIAPGGDTQFVGPDPGIHFDGAGDQVGMILTAAVHAGTLNNNVPPIHIVTGELAVIKLRLTGRQGHTVGVDKTAALAGNARRVSDNHLCLAPCHLDIPIEFTGVAAVDFVENNAGLTPRQPRIAVDKTTEFGLVDAVAVI
ncbi:Uncharacterised protein [Yersinia wautersii]|uniref:Uncharacterized protein n=1 Tax=Yersinia wautersii TaxID=1341643 RepID=A0ABM9TES7_9GAMM|nr:Uncharacterised protein [Yersinia wautersii]